jgi:hypothetical protein
LVVKKALKPWRHWLGGSKHPFLVWTDHRNLECIREAKRLNPRQARWALFFARFQFTISYRPGSKNVKEDALSRLYDAERQGEETPSSRIIGRVVWDVDTDIRQAYGRHSASPPAASVLSLTHPATSLMEAAGSTMTLVSPIRGLSH